MNEIRFSNPIKKEEENSQAPVSEVVVDKKMKSKSNSSKILKSFLILVFFIILISGVVLGRDLVSSFFSNEKNEWSAVFLSNGQVYFGKIDSNNKTEMTLTSVYYLQADQSLEGQASDALNQSRFKLVKLGQELHGPKDIMIINKDSVMFYEYLREDSKVVESIKNFK